MTHILNKTRTQMSRISIAAALAFAASTVPVLAQDAQQTDARLGDLLASGFEIKAMQYLPRSMVFTLQNADRAFVCETDLDGQNTLCVELE